MDEHRPKEWVKLRDAALAKVEQRIDKAVAAFNHGFYAKAHQKEALDQLNRAYEAIRDKAHDLIIDEANATFGQPQTPGAWDAWKQSYADRDLPFDLHQVRPRHLPILAQYGEFGAKVAQLIELREEIKAAPILPVIKDETKAKIERVRETLIELIERRQGQFLEAVEIGHEFGGLPVTVNAHWVTHEKGTRFLRHFFYLNGKLTALVVILAAAQKLEQERKAAEEAA